MNIAYPIDSHGNSVLQARDSRKTVSLGSGPQYNPGCIIFLFHQVQEAIAANTHAGVTEYRNIKRTELKSTLVIHYVFTLCDLTMNSQFAIIKPCNLTSPTVL